jgi:rhodanese-related sulfurtransferase
MKNGKLKTFLGLTFLLLFAVTIPAYAGDDAPRISTEELKEILGSADLVLLDARKDKDWNKSDIKIVGAVRVDPSDVGSWADNYGKEQKIVLYCA